MRAPALEMRGSVNTPVCVPATCRSLARWTKPPLGRSPFDGDGYMNGGLALAVPSELVEAAAERVAELLADRLDALLAPPPEGYLDVDRAAAYLAAKRSRIYELAESGRLRSYRDGRRLLFRRDDLDAALDVREVEAK